MFVEKRKVYLGTKFFLKSMHTRELPKVHEKCILWKNYMDFKKFLNQNFWLTFLHELFKVLWGTIFILLWLISFSIISWRFIRVSSSHFLKGFIYLKDSYFMCWFPPQMAAKARTLELHRGVPRGWQRSKYSGHLPLPSQAPQQGAGSKVEQPGLEFVLMWDPGVTGGGLTHSAITPVP